VSELARTQNQIDANSITPEKLKEWVESPLKQLPIEWRPAVWEFWSLWNHLLPSQLTLCSRLRIWRTKHDLTLDQLRIIFDKLNHPGRVREMKFASDLLASLANEVFSALEAKRILTEQEQRRAGTSSGILSGSEIKERLANAFKPE
jgi:hypothetical protein